jgi:YbgC/YbaW family acyl-CoA thioester hydrolase
MSGPTYTLPLRVRMYDLDLRGQVSCSTLFRYFEETAMQASSQLGFTLDWYNDRGQFWVIRTMSLERNSPAQYQDDLEIRTWVSAMTRVRADRNYLVRRVRDGRVLVRATANWVYLDRKTMYPARIAPEIVAMFTNAEPPALPQQKTTKSLLDLDLDIQGHSARRALYYDADSARHTNNAVYVNWLEEAVRETLLAKGYSLGLDGGPSPWFYRHSVEYLNPARPGDELEIETKLIGRGKSAGQWRQQVRRVHSHEVVAREECVTIWVDEQNRPIRWHEASASHLDQSRST